MAPEQDDNVDVMGDKVAVYRKFQDGNVSCSQLESKLFCNKAFDWSELASQNNHGFVVKI